MPDAFRLNSFDDFLRLAQQQLEPHRLLFVLAQRAIYKGATDVQVQQFEVGLGGVFLPVAGFDLMPNEMTGFAQLMTRLEDTQEGWDLLLVSPCLVRLEVGDTEAATQQALRDFMSRIKLGQLDHTLAFDTEGIPVLLEPME